MDKVKSLILLLLLLSIIVTCCPTCNGGQNLGRGFTYWDPPKSISYWKRNSFNFEIPPVIVSYVNTRNILLMKQHPQEYDNVMFSSPNYSYGRDTLYYWFVDKRTKDVLGPYSYSEMVEVLEGKDLLSLLEKLECK